MGCTVEQKVGCYDDELPVHIVSLPSFYISKYEVSQSLYESIAGVNPSRNKGENLPVESVTWYDAIRFCNALSEKEGLQRCYTINGNNVMYNTDANGYRLPTEAEWEYAAREAKKNSFYLYSGSSDADSVAWYYSNSYSPTRKDMQGAEGEAGKKAPQEIGTKRPNALGIYDMSGNVFEWCWDYFSLDYYAEGPENNPLGPESGTVRVLRGGGWYSHQNMARVSARKYYLPERTKPFYGFRVVRKTLKK